MIKTCDHKCVGMMVWQNEKLLLIERARFPYGFAPPAGHCDMNEFEEADYSVIAKKELQEEVGLTVRSLKLLIEGRKDNPCRREDGTWHYWQIFEVEAEGEVTRSEEETKKFIWADKEKLESLVKRTEEYQTGSIAEEKWQNNPGLEPVWYDWLKKLRII